MLFCLPTFAILAVAAILSIFSLRRPVSRPFSAALFATVALAAYVLVRAVLSPIAYLAWPDAFTAAGCLILYLLTALYLTETRHRLWFVGVLFAIAALEVAVGIIQFAKNHQFMLFPFPRPEGADWRAGGLFISGNHLAGYLEAVAMFALAMTCWSRWKLPARILTGYLVLLCYFGVAISGSRGGCISSAFSLLCFGALSVWSIGLITRKRIPAATISIALAVIVGLGAGAALIASTPSIRRRVTVNPLEDVRRFNWLAALDQFRTSPWVGTGAGTHLIYGRLFRRQQIQTDPVHAHGDYLEMLAEYGVAGEILAILFLSVHLVYGLRSAREIATRRLRDNVIPPRSDTLALNLGSLGALAALLSHSVVDFNMHIPGNALLFSFIFGILANPATERSSKSPAWLSVTTFLRFALFILGAATLAEVLPKIKGEQLSEKARIALRDKQYADCIPLAQTAITAQPINPNNYFYLGESNRVIGLSIRIRAVRPLYFERAEAAYKGGLAYFPQDESLLVRYAQALDGLGRYPEAEQAYLDAIRWDPNLGILYAYYGAHLRLTHQPIAANQCYEAANQISRKNHSDVGMAETRSLLDPRGDRDSGDATSETSEEIH